MWGDVMKHALLRDEDRLRREEPDVYINGIFSASKYLFISISCQLSITYTFSLAENHISINFKYKFGKMRFDRTLLFVAMAVMAPMVVSRLSHTFQGED
jgi:hypothetical protein